MIFRNSKLYDVIQKAKANNMPNDTIFNFILKRVHEIREKFLIWK